MAEHGPILYAHTQFDAYRRRQDGKIECLSQGQVVLVVDRVIAAIGRTLNSDANIFSQFPDTEQIKVYTYLQVKEDAH